MGRNKIKSRKKAVRINSLGNSQDAAGFEHEHGQAKFPLRDNVQAIVKIDLADVENERLNVRRSSLGTKGASGAYDRHDHRVSKSTKEAVKRRQSSSFYRDMEASDAQKTDGQTFKEHESGLQSLDGDSNHATQRRRSRRAKNKKRKLSDGTLSHERQSSQSACATQLEYQRPNRLQHDGDETISLGGAKDNAAKQFHNFNKTKFDGRAADYVSIQDKTFQNTEPSQKSGTSTDTETSSDSQQLQPLKLRERDSTLSETSISDNLSQSQDTTLKLDKPSKLKFDDVLPDSQSKPSNISPSQVAANKRAEQAQRKANRSAAQLEKAQSQLPKKYRLKCNKTIDLENKNPKLKRKLCFESEVKDQASHIKGDLPTRPIKLGANTAIAYGHKKIYMVERENVGTEAAHKGELLAEDGLRRVYRRHKTKRYRKVAKLESKTARLNAKSAYRKAIADNTHLQKSFTSRMIQKYKINRQYAKAVRESKTSSGALKKSAQMIGKVTNAFVRLAGKSPKMLFIVGMLFCLFMLISSAFVSCSGIMSGLGQAVMTTSYLAEDAHIDDAAIAYTEWETELEIRLQNIRTEFPGFDEYRINGANIGHNPFELMAYLTVVHHDFTYPEIRAILRELFDEQYQLTIVPSIEIRHYLNEYNEPLSYEWHVLTVTLTSRSFSGVINSRMNAAERQHFDLLMHSRGHRQYVGSPFSFNWIPFISSHYGWRIHPISGTPEFHTGVDIALPGGTEIQAALGGIVTFAGYNGGYGNFVVIDHGNGLITRYAHCDTILVNVGQVVSVGDVIATVGNTGVSAGNHLHFEVIRNGRFLNPIFFALTGEGVNRPSFGFPGIPLDDERFAALIAEAERHLGIPYVWGGSTPSQGFDCSGFVSYVLRAAGIRDVGRLTAQGLFNVSTPVSSSDVRPGDLVFFQGTFSSYRTVTHVGIYVGNSYMIHTGSNPAGVEYTNINTPFWQRHFFAFGRV